MFILSLVALYRYFTSIKIFFEFSSRHECEEPCFISLIFQHPIKRSTLGCILILACAVFTAHAQALINDDFQLSPAPETEISAVAPLQAQNTTSPPQRVDQQITGALNNASQTVGNVTGNLKYQ